MKVLTICQSDMAGGAERVAFDLTRKLNNYINNDLLVDIGKTNFPFVHTLGRNVLEKKISKVLNKTLNTQGIMCFSKDKFRQIMKQKYDVIHFHNIHGDYFDINNLILISELGIPVVWTMHDRFTKTGRCAVEYDCIHWKNKCGKCGYKIYNTYPKMLIDNSRFIHWYKKKYISPLKLTVVTPSNWMAGMVKESYLKNKRISVIHNGVDLDVYKRLNKKDIRKKYNLPCESKYIAIVAAKLNDKHKGINYFLEAINKLEKKEEYIILVVGNNFDKTLVNNIRVINFGYVSESSKLNEIYSMADIFINPSLRDNFPCTNLEAMGSGTAVLSTNVGGIPEQVDENTGFIIETAELNDLSKLIEYLFSDVNGLWLKGIKGREKVEQSFSLQTSVNEYIELYTKVTNQ